MLTSTLEVKVQWKNTHAPEWSRRWCGQGTGTNIISLRLKSTNHSALENWKWNLRFNFFQLWAQEFSSKIYERVQDSKLSTFGACYIIKPRPYRQNNGNKEPKRTECWQTLNQKFRYHYFQTIINFYLEPQIVFMASNDWSRALKKIRAKKSGALCRAILDLTQSPAIFSQSRLKFNTCVDINFGVQSAMKKHPCTWKESALMWTRDRDKHNQSSIEKYKSQCIGKLKMEFAIQFFSIMGTRIFE